MLRALQEKDAEGMLEWMHDREIQRNFRMDTIHKKHEDVILFIQNAEVEPINGQSVHYAVVDELDEYLGTISLKNIDMLAKKAEYAICLRKKAHGKGVATQATKELLQMAFEQFGLERIYLNVLSDNAKAIKLYEKCGFLCEGEFRNHLFLYNKYHNLRWYAILREEYIKAKA